MTTTPSRGRTRRDAEIEEAGGVAVPHLSLAERVARVRRRELRSRVRLTRRLSRHRRKLIRSSCWKFSQAYGEQNEHDFRRLAAAVDSGGLVARTGL